MLTESHKNGRIIIVDDDELISQYLALLLEAEGHEVTVMNAPQEALACFHARPDDFDLVVTDQVMPGLTGVEVAAAVLKLRPKIPVLLITGYSKKVNAENAESFGLSGFFSKPINEPMFLNKISDLLTLHAI